VAPAQPCTAAQARSFPALAAAPPPTALRLRQGPLPISEVGARMASAAVVFLRPDTEWATEAPQDFATSRHRVREAETRSPLAGEGGPHSPSKDGGHWRAHIGDLTVATTASGLHRLARRALRCRRRRRTRSAPASTLRRRPGICLASPFPGSLRTHSKGTVPAKRTVPAQ